MTTWTPADPDGDPQPDNENVAPPHPPNPCPVCNGQAFTVYHGFLHDIREEPCEACEGTGVDLSKEEGQGGYCRDDTPTQPHALGDTD